MTKDPDVQLQLDDYPVDAGLLSEIDLWEQKQLPVMTLNSSIDNIDRIRSALLAMRSANISPVLLLKRNDRLLEDEEIAALFGYLRDWDQLLLANFLEICGEWVPLEYQRILQTEAKTELKWFREWMTASSDRRIHMYPGLPWRSFVRKIVGENYEFAMEFLKLAGCANTSENVQAMQARLKAFIEAKKKVVCVFPKRWSKTQ